MGEIQLDFMEDDDCELRPLLPPPELHQVVPWMYFACRPTTGKCKYVFNFLIIVHWSVFLAAVPPSALL